jgi:replicative DNA helicase
MQMRNRARRLVYEYGLDAIFCDYIQLMSGGGEDRYSNRDQEIGYISRSLKGMAKELSVPVIAAAQLSRAVDQREDKHPMLSDLRESGNIENDADLVGFFYREDYYKQASSLPVVSRTEIGIAKHRGGKRDMIIGGFYGELKKFVAMEQGR